MSQLNVNISSKPNTSYDAIVVGSGISGGWAAKELCEKGLKTLLLERGRNVEHIKDYHTAFKKPWDFKNRLLESLEDQEENPIQCQAYDEGSKHFYVNDKEHPYIQEKPFNWIRGYQLGGRSLTWGRQCYRLSDLDFEANLKEDIAVDWPIRYKDLAPWYDYVERFVGIAGRNEGLSYLPDGKFQPPIEMNCVEDYFSKEIRKEFPGRVVTPGRSANLTESIEGRGPCQFRNLCDRGCPFSGYFSSNSATLPAALKTGNLTLQTDSIVMEVLYDKDKNRAEGVRVIDAVTNEESVYYADIIFLNASTIATAAILLNSATDQFPEGLGNSSGQLGHNLMDHFVIAGAEGEFHGFEDQYYYGRNPGCIYIPRFRNLDDTDKGNDFTRGYAFQGYGERMSWRDKYKTLDGFGEEYKKELMTPGPWRLWIGAWGETLPYYDNKVALSTTQKDKWGLPLVKIDFQYHSNEENMRNDIKSSAYEMLEKTGFKNIEVFDHERPGGSAVHEMGTARMGRDPKTSVLNGFNQMHDVKNIFITDGSCMTSSACQNPSLTYMALTARACDYAAREMKQRNL
ncbi:GMC family oxidoreductase [Fulvivirga sp. M361]|uniref:GMC oxidoreductase n=1 Tax=Fulvivirga sp. M361 TaxID=2594266 RepID=UPI00117A06E3|nr:GMC family oxidoreductase [Fulvivirga sp. M361]TRX60125.1 GMC family oxidoreductase [Fulvivirga sp. M361]